MLTNGPADTTNGAVIPDTTLRA